MTDQKKYINFIDMHRKTYPDLKKKNFWGGGGGGGGGQVDVIFWKFAGGRVTKIEQMQTTW